MKEVNTHQDDVLVIVENLSKKFCKDLKTSLWYGVKDLWSGVTGNENERLLREKEFWAVKDISFTLRRGECLGLIGHNGAGKSTLLKILNGLINPDAGKVTIKGRVGALIELGAGFNPILSGRENIYNNGAILGFSRKEIDSKLDHIITFAELEEFIDMPVQNYSSGMKVRLGFAVAAQMEPDVLIIDEVLAVGDLGFVLKCFKTIDAILPKTAIVFVSHNMPMVSRICNHILLMENGVSKYQGNDVAKGIDLYYMRFVDNDINLVYSDDTIELVEVKLLGALNKEGDIPQLNWLDDLKLHFKFKLKKPIENIPIFTAVIFDKEQRPIAYLNHNDVKSGLNIVDNKIEFIVEHKSIELSKGIYNIQIVASKTYGQGHYLIVNGILTFQILDERDIFPPFLLASNFQNL